MDKDGGEESPFSFSLWFLASCPCLPHILWGTWEHISVGSQNFSEEWEGGAALHVRAPTNLEKPTGLHRCSPISLHSKNVPAPKHSNRERLSLFCVLSHHPASHDFSLSDSNLRLRPWFSSTHNELPPLCLFFFCFLRPNFLWAGSLVDFAFASMRIRF